MIRRAPIGWSLLLALMLGGGVPALGSPAPPEDLDGPRVPVALAWGAGGRLWVALRDGREVVAVNPTAGRVVSRVGLPGRPSSLAVVREGRRKTLVVGGMDGEVMAVRDGEASLMVPAGGRGRARVVGVGGGRVAVTSVWDERVRVIDVGTGRVVRAVALGFPPGAMAARPGKGLFVADAFGGRLAGVDLDTGRVRVRTLDGVNLRALAVSPDGKELLIGHMAQYGTMPLTSTNIDWGLILSSHLSAVRLADLDPTGPERDGSPLPRRRLTLDGSGHGAADPAALAVSADGSILLVALAGAHQLLKVDRRLGPPAEGAPGLLPLGDSQRLDTVDVGATPADVAFDPSGDLAVSADSMGDTLTLVRVRGMEVVETIHLGSRVTRRSAAQRGEAAFLDGRRSLDRWMSCASCHPAGHTTGLHFDTLGDGGYGAAKNAPSLLGCGPTAPYGWTGRFTTLAEQIHQSLQTSLRGRSADEGTASDLAAYLQTLTPPPPRLSPHDPAARRGAAVFEARRCQSCHRPPHYTGTGLKDVGLDDGPGGHRAFNPPSLRGVGWSAPYFHDGRAATLDDVLSHHHPGSREPLSPAERGDLRAFLESL